MFKFKTVTETDLQKVYALKEQANQLSKIKYDQEFWGGQTDLVMPHDSYIIGLSSLKSENEVKPQISGVQIIGASNIGFNSIFSLSSFTGAVLKDRKYLKSYEHAFEKILYLNVAENDFEIRSIKVPALHVEALWLHKIDNDNNNDNDLFTTIRSMGLFESNKMYDKQRFFEILKNAVTDYDLNDDLIGG